MHSDDLTDSDPSARRLSYKFQRLRERIRAAIAAGDLAGKLPGERSLARQFNVNAKTLSKALTDLAAEGVLERNIGLGTFVRDHDAAPVLPKIMLLTAGEDAMADCLRQHGVPVQAHTDPDVLPPSVLARFDLILIGTAGVADSVIRDLLVRGKTVLTLDRVVGPMTTHAVLTHDTLALTHAARHLAANRHHRIAIVQNDPDDPAPLTALTEALPDIDWHPARPDEAVAAARTGYTAVLCDTPELGRAVLAACRAAHVITPQGLSVAAAGRLRGDAPCSGHYVTDGDTARTVATMIQAGLPPRPVTLWLSGTAVDVGTIAHTTRVPEYTPPAVPPPD